MQDRILLVEDDRYLTQGLTELLERNQYQITAADRVAAAWEQLKTEHFDLLIMDVSLPDGDGVNLCQRLRQAGISAPILFRRHGMRNMTSCGAWTQAATTM